MKKNNQNSGLHAISSTLWCISLLVTMMMIGCDDEPSQSKAGTMAGESVAGESVAGTMAGESVAGTMAGESVAGTMAGESVAGTMAGESMAGTMAGESMAGTMAGESMAGTMAGESMAGTMAGESMAGTMMEMGLPLDQLIPETASAMCQGLFSCCDMDDFEVFFSSLAYDLRYEDYVDLFPPQTELTEANCQATLETLLDVAPFGSWRAQTEAGQVTYDGVAAQECLDSLRNASCGDEFLTAVYDGTCLSFASPLGGEDQRKMFTRTNGVGSECSPINDGQGGVIYGTCNPQEAFCCVRREDGTCKPGLPEEIGECVAVSPIGEACSILPSLQVCATGSNCGEDGICALPTEYITVQLGEACSEGFSLFGICENSWCDLGNTGICQALSADGEMCVFPYECETGACVNGVCGPDTYCR